MNTSRPINDEHVRLWIVFVFMICALLFLGAHLWRIQVFRGHEFQSSQMKQSVRNVRVPGVRGRIYDRNNVCLVDNKPSFNVALYLEELRRPGAWSNTISGVEKLVAEVSDIIRRPPELSRDDIRAHVRKRLPLPLTAWRGIDEAALARLMEKTAGRVGLDITTDAVRIYPFGKLASQTIGYVGRSNPAETASEEDESYHYFLPEIEGKSGLEKILDDQLRGVAGGRLLRIDVSGYRRDDIGQVEPTPGRDVQLALDAKIQKLVEDALGDTPGAAAILDPRNGDVLALASSPSFDPNSFVPFITTAAWEELATDPHKPLLNRAISEHYSPGSTFKPVTLMAALGSGKLLGEEHYDCSGVFEIGAQKFHCWNRAGHGDLGISKAIEFSCNVYMFNSALLCGAQPIHDMAAALGLGTKTRIGLEGETGGHCPDDAWKRKVFREGWRSGDTCNYSIGQGFLSTTPLQMALLTAAFANGGSLYRPRLVSGSRAAGDREFAKIPPELVRQMTWNLNHLNIVRRGMFDVVMSPTGTGRLAHAPGVQMAGKTGTAQFESRGEMKRHAWMIAFAPYNEPRYAIAMVVDEGVSGGETIAPRIKKIFTGLFPQTTGNGASG